MRRMLSFLLFFLLLSRADGQGKSSIQALLDSLRLAGNFPGLSLAFADKTGNVTAYASGFSNKEQQLLLRVTDRLLQGSVGKTYVAAIALGLVKEGKLDLNRKVSAYLGSYPWYQRIPNAADITVRMIMNHSSGVMRYEFKQQFTSDLTRQPSRYWEPAELLAYILDEKAAFGAGTDWEYSDTNYILLGLILETITGKKYVDLLREKLLRPLKLTNTLPSDSRKLPGLIQGYAGAENEFGGKDQVLDSAGTFIINPQFEWTGGGIYSTTSDLARWGQLLYGGRVADTSLLLHEAVPAKLGKNTRYGLGVIIRETSLGRAYGHSGFFPGYMTELLYFPQEQLAVALQCNSSDFKNLKLSLLHCLVELTKAQTGSR